MLLVLFCCRDLSLSGNPLGVIENGALQYISQLVKLDLSRCQIVKIEDFVFTPLTLLESLKINSNQLTGLSNATV